jgi:hypothetical protein
MFVFPTPSPSELVSHLAIDFHFITFEPIITRHCDKKKTKLRGLSPQTNYTDRVTAAVGEVVLTFAGRGCYVVSAADSYGC